MENPGKKAVGRSGRQGEGPFMYIELACEERTVTAASFETYGCPSAIKCGDWVSKWAVGRNLELISRLDEADLTLVVGGLPLGKEHCAKMAVEALRDAVTQIASQSTE